MPLGLPLSSKLTAVLLSFIACFNDTYIYTWNQTTETLTASTYNGDVVASARLSDEDITNVFDVKVLCTNRHVVVLGNFRTDTSSLKSFVLSYPKDLSERLYVTTYNLRILDVHLCEDTLYLLMRDKKDVDSVHCRSVFSGFNRSSLPYSGQESIMRGNKTHLVLCSVYPHSFNNKYVVTVYTLRTRDVKTIHVNQPVKDVMLGSSYVYFKHNYAVSRCLIETDATLPIMCNVLTNDGTSISKMLFLPDSENYLIEAIKGSLDVSSNGKIVFSKSISSHGSWKLIGHYLFIIDDNFHGNEWWLYDLTEPKPITPYYMQFADDYAVKKLVLEPFRLRLEGGKTSYMPLPGKSTQALLKAKDLGLLVDYFIVLGDKCILAPIIENIGSLSGYALVMPSDKAWDSVLNGVSRGNTFYANDVPALFHDAFISLLINDDPHIFALMFIAFGEGIWGAPKDLSMSMAYYEGADKSTIKRYYK